MTITELAKMSLSRRKVAIPETDVEVRMAAYVAMKEDDFLQAHIYRLNKERVDFTKEDWASVLKLSGAEEVKGNMRRMWLACPTV